MRRTLVVGILVCIAGLFEAPSAGEGRRGAPRPAPEYERDRSTFVVQVRTEGTWQVVQAFVANRFFVTRTVDLGRIENAGPLVVRIRARGGTAHIDALRVNAAEAVRVGGGFETEVAEVDFDVVEVPAGGFEAEFDIPRAGPAVLEITGRIDPPSAALRPFRFPLGNLGREVDSGSAFYAYRPGSQPGRLTIDGDLAGETLGSPFFSERWPCGSGHPLATTWGWVFDDGEHLYVAVDFNPDNTPDRGDHEAVLHVRRKDDVAEFRLSASEPRWGRSGFVYTPWVRYRHAAYEFRVPLAEIRRKESEPIRFAVSIHSDASAAVERSDALAFERRSAMFGLAYSDVDGVVNLQRFSPDGQVQGGATELGADSGRRPQTAVAANPVSSAFFVVWDEASEDRVLGRVVTASGAPAAPAVTLSDVHGGDAPAAPRVAFDSANRRYLVVWTDERAGAGTSAVFGRFAAENGTPRGRGSFEISGTDSGTVVPGSLGIAHDPKAGRFLVTWAFESGGVWARLVNADGSRSERAFAVSAADADCTDATYHPLTGGFFVAYTGTDNAEVLVCPVEARGRAGAETSALTGTWLQNPRLAVHPTLPRFVCAAADDGRATAFAQWVSAEGEGIGRASRLFEPGTGPVVFGAAANPWNHGAAVGTVAVPDGLPEISYARGLCVQGEPGAIIEGGGGRAFWVNLCAEPEGRTEVDVAAGVADPSALTFTPADWHVPQQVLVTAVDFGVRDGMGAGLVRLEVDPGSSSPDYRGINDAVRVGSLDAIFSDGFETGDASRWSGVVD